MDIKRKKNLPLRRLRLAAVTTVIIAVVSGIGFGLSRLKSAAPTVDRNVTLTDVVKRGSMLRQVRGIGALVPEDNTVRQISSPNPGRVERINLRPGATVHPQMTLIELSNPEIEQAAIDAELQLKAAESEAASLRVRLERERLDLQAAAATVQAGYTQAKLRADAEERLFKDGLIADITRKSSQATAEEFAARRDIERQRLAGADESQHAQIAAQQARLTQLRALYELRRRQVDALRITAGAAGVLQQLSVEIGQQVTPGTPIAKVVDPTSLKAQVRVAETQAKDIAVGQRAVIDTRNGTVDGAVARIDPAVQNGTVAVDIQITEPMPKGARPDLSVDGVIELERLENILYVNRPIQAQPNATIGLFKLVENDTHAVRTAVKLGRTSVNTIEVLDGLQEGDKVILSDMSAWDAVDRIRLQ
jgi:HlyD family secretion protein